MQSFSPGPIDPEHVPSRVFLCYIHLGVKVRGFEAVEARVGDAMRPRVQGGLVDTEAEHSLLAYFLESMLDTLCRLSPEREWAAGYEDVLGRLSRAGSGGGGGGGGGGDTAHRLCKRLYAMLMGFGILPTLPGALPALPALSEWQVKHLACGHGIAGLGSTSSGSSDAPMGIRVDSDYSSGSGSSCGSGRGSTAAAPCEKLQQQQQHNPRPDTPAIPCLGPPPAPGFSPRPIRAGASHASQPESNYTDTLIGRAAAAAAAAPPPPEPQLCRGCSDPSQNRGVARDPTSSSSSGGGSGYPYAGIDGFPPYHSHPQQQVYDGLPPLLPLPPPASPPAAAATGPLGLYRAGGGTCSPAPAAGVVPRAGPGRHARHRSLFPSVDAGPYGAPRAAVPPGPTWG